jgi:hypothetical protein
LFWVRGFMFCLGMTKLQCCSVLCICLCSFSVGSLGSRWKLLSTGYPKTLEKNSTNKFLAEKSIPLINQQPYTPGLTPSDFWPFPTLKMGLKETRFTTMEDINSNVMAKLQIPKEAFHWWFQQWQDQWSKCVCVCVCKGPTSKVIR